MAAAIASADRADATVTGKQENCCCRLGRFKPKHVIDRIKASAGTEPCRPVRFAPDDLAQWRISQMQSTAAGSLASGTHRDELPACAASSSRSQRTLAAAQSKHVARLQSHASLDHCSCRSSHTHRARWRRECEEQLRRLVKLPPRAVTTMLLLRQIAAVGAAAFMRLWRVTPSQSCSC